MKKWILIVLAISIAFAFALPANAQEEPELRSKEGEAVTVLAKIIWGEARGLPAMERAAVVWCILNRVDSNNPEWPDTVLGVALQPNQFCYSSGFRATDENVEIARDVLNRWLQEKLGMKDVGRVLPKEYVYFVGDGVHNYFRDRYRGGKRWDWSVENPYTGLMEVPVSIKQQATDRFAIQ